MNLLGISLRRPRFWEVTTSAFMATGLWVALLGLMKVGGLALSRNDAGALLLVILWGALSVRLGVRIGQGANHLAANIVVSAVLLGAYQLATAI
jgi:hypothetical protein